MQNCVSPNLAECAELRLVFENTINEMDANQKQRIINQCGANVFDLSAGMKCKSFLFKGIGEFHLGCFFILDRASNGNYIDVI